LGRATEKDVFGVRKREGRRVELVDGVLIEKRLSAQGTHLAARLEQEVGDLVRRCNSGLVTGPDTSICIIAGLVRIPDVAFVGWGRFPERRIPLEPIPELVPDLAVEVLSEKNTDREMARKLKDYFLAGVKLVWYIDPRKRLARVHTAPDEMTVLREGEALEGGDVLPGFRLPLAELFDLLEAPSGPAGAKKKGKKKPPA
jgi:Uma2 family endonuclease